MNRKAKISMLLLLLSNIVLSQDLEYARSIVKELSMGKYHGRGYIHKGDSLASIYLAKQMKENRLKHFGDNYFQNYSTSINTFPYELKVSINDKNLIPGVDFLVHSQSSSIKGTFPVRKLTNADLTLGGRELTELLESDFSDVFLMIDSSGLSNPELYKFAKTCAELNWFKAKGIIILGDSILAHSVKPKAKDFPMIIVNRYCIDDSISEIKLDIKNKFIDEYKTRNLIGYVKGKVDTFIVFCAHYDHLGRMGTKAMFPGANDNASGAAIVLDFARRYSKIRKKPYYSMVFMLFSGEEAGKLGSEYYVENPLFDLSKIKVVLNFDMVGTGKKGLLVFSGKEYPEEFKIMKNINEKEKLIKNIVPLALSKRSDHYSFHKKGKKAFFFLTYGGGGDYHTISDTYKNCNFEAYEGLFKLIEKYIAK